MGQLFTALSKKIESFEASFNVISEERQKTLKSISVQLAEFINTHENQIISLLFVCTHNSRRSHISQIWAQGIAYHYGFETIRTYSGGTEATAFFPSAVKAMQEMGFEIIKVNEVQNPLYDICYADTVGAFQAFSKTVEHQENPNEDFIALMTCSHADENCPFIPGATLRIPLLYQDPKTYDGTPIAQQKYFDKAEEIGRELSFIFSLM